MTSEDGKDLSSILRRVQKLLAIAEDSRGDPNETAAAAQQAEKIMRKYQIEYADLLVTNIKRGMGEEFDSQYVNANMKRHDKKRPPLRRVPPWAQWLAVATARLNGCEVQLAFIPEQGAHLKFYGFKSDVQVAAWMFDFMVDAMIRNTKAWQKNMMGIMGKRESESYRRGFVTALIQSVKRIEADRAREMAAASSSRALVVVKQAAIAEHFGEAKYGQNKSNHRPDVVAFVAGSRDGAKVDVNRRAVENSGNSTKQIGSE